MAGAFVLGLLAALGWGITDAITRLGSQAIGVFRTIFYNSLIGFLAVSLWLAGDPAAQRGFAETSLWVWAATAAAALINLGATGALFVGMNRGRVSLVAAIMTSYGAVSALLAALTGEPVSAGLVAGLATTLAGVALVAAAPALPGADGESRPTGIGWGALAALGYGVGFWVQGKYAVPVLGPVLPVWVYYGAGLVLFAAAGLLGGRSLARPRGRQIPVALAIALTSVGGFACFSFGLDTGYIAIVSVLSTLSSGVTALLGVAMFGERLAMRQWAGIALILIGVAVIRAVAG